MAGLSVILEAQQNLPKQNTHIISKTSLPKNSSPSSSVSPSSSSSSSSSSFSTSAFLEHCYLCRRKLRQGSDIFMYRGDRAFCSVECRCRQMHMDEESGGKRHHCSVAATAAGRGRAMAGGFAY